MWSNANESGTVQVIVQPFPDPSGGKWQVSGKEGTFAKWRRDGRELYYLDPEGQIIAVPVETEHNFEFGRPTPLFKTPGPNTPYEITPDGQRFLVLADAAAVNLLLPRSPWCSTGPQPSNVKTAQNKHPTPIGRVTLRCRF
jgi:hypothetical protein